MKKIMLLIILIFLTSCSNIELEQWKIKYEIYKDNCQSVWWQLKHIQNINKIFCFDKNNQFIHIDWYEDFIINK